MRVPIAYALAWPERIETPCERLDLVRTGHLSFEEPDLERFPCIALAREALRTGGASPAVLNAANEIAVASFLADGIGFLDIAAVVGETLERCAPAAPSTIEDVLEIDARAREIARQLIGKHVH
jgi:1-deoxy-D-xylulose-5-phosphate reductoisomerase